MNAPEAATPAAPSPTGTAGRRVRIDKQHRQVYRAQLAVAEAVRAAVADAGLGRDLAELVKIRVSQLNRCAFCLDLHVREALLAGESAQRLAVLPAWRDTTLFTDQERAALTLAESLTTLPDAETQEREHAAAAAVLTDEQLSAVSWLVIAMNSFNRLSIVSKHRVRPAAHAATAAQAATHVLPSEGESS